MSFKPHPYYVSYWLRSYHAMEFSIVMGMNSNNEAHFTAEMVEWLLVYPVWLQMPTGPYDENPDKFHRVLPIIMQCHSPIVFRYWEFALLIEYSVHCAHHSFLTIFRLLRELVFTDEPLVNIKGWIIAWLLGWLLFDSNLGRSSWHSINVMLVIEPCLRSYSFRECPLWNSILNTHFVWICLDFLLYLVHYPCCIFWMFQANIFYCFTCIGTRVAIFIGLSW